MPLRLDIHVHGFATAGDSFISPKMRKSLAFRYLARRLGLHAQRPTPQGNPEPAGDDLGAAYLQALRGALDATPELDAVVLLGMDGRYDAQGELDRVSSPYVFGLATLMAACAQDPRLLPGPSINPARRDALDALDEAAARGAVLIKTIPNSQDFDPAEARFRPFWRKLAALGLPWLTHSGREHTLSVTEQAYGEPQRLVPALEEGVTVIAAHAGAAGISPGPESFPAYLDLLARFPNLYGDLSALTNLSRAGYLRHFFQRPELFERMLHGSDYPVPAVPERFVLRLGFGALGAIRRQGNLLSTSALLLARLGAPESVFTRADGLLRISDAQRAGIAAHPRPTAS